MTFLATPETWQVRPDAIASRMIPGARVGRATLKARHARDVHPRTYLISNEGMVPRSLPAVLQYVVPLPLARHGRWRLGCAVASDFAFSLLGWLFVGGCSSVLSNNFRIGHPTPYSYWVAVWILYGSLVTLHAQSEGLYAGDLRASQPIGRLLLAKSIVAATVITGIAAILARKALPSPGWIVAGAISNFVALLLLRRWQEVARDRKPTINVLIVGAGPVARAVARYFRQNPQLGRVVRGFLDDATAPAFGVLGPTSSLAHIARAEFADEVIIATGTDVSETQLIAQEARAQHLDVRLVSTLPIDVGDHPWIENWAGFPVITLHREDVPFAGLALKRAIDVLVSSGLLILLSPLLLALAILIRIDSDGPSLYSAERVGRKGRKFICYKFRTMVRNANGAREDLRAQNEREGPCFKLDNDPRVTRIGRFLRRYSLDELPQLWNVIRGEMTLVGPRPHPVDDCSRYDLPHLRRLDATPGMTGLWQVSARQASSFETNLRLDLEYIEHWNLWLDFKILAKTLSVVVRGTGT